MTTETQSKELVIVGLSNEIPAAQTGVSRVLRIPFGEHPHPDGTVMQVNAATAGKIYAALRTLFSQGKRGPIVYNGHPDSGAAIPADPREYGRVVDVAQEPSALALTCALTEEGIKLVRGGKRWFSPHWLSSIRDALSWPFELLSVGLTDRPVIRVDAIACSAAGRVVPREGQKGVPMRDKLLALLKTRGIELAADATDDAISGAYEAEFGKTATQANELASRDAEIITLRGQLATAEGATAAAVADAKAKVEALACEQKLRRELLLDVALSDGRVPPAARKAWEAKFDADFAATVTALACAKPVMKVVPQANAAGRDPETTEAKQSADRSAYVAQVRNELGCSNAEAWEEARRRKPTLFA